jgi:hypothetical protein
MDRSVTRRRFESDGTGQISGVNDDRPTTDRLPAIDVFAPKERRRFARYGDPIPVPTLVDQSLRSAELQLLDAREALKDARRRVVQLEDALESWRALRDAMTRAASDASRAVAN